MNKIDLETEDFKIVMTEGDPLSLSIKECMEKINEIIDWINSQ